MKPYAQIAEQFARALVAGDFDAAHEFLASNQKQRVSAADLKEKFESMIDYGPGYGPIIHVEVMNTLEEWRAKKEGDVGWAYVALSGSNYCEGVAVVVIEQEGGFLIRDIEWGRP